MAAGPKGSKCSEAREGQGAREEVRENEGWLKRIRRSLGR